MADVRNLEYDNKIGKLKHNNEELILDNNTDYELKAAMDTKYLTPWKQAVDIYLYSGNNTIINPNTLTSKKYTKMILELYSSSDRPRITLNGAVGYHCINSNGIATNNVGQINGTSIYFDSDDVTINKYDPINSTQFNSFGTSIFITYINSLYLKVEMYSAQDSLIFRGTATSIKIEEYDDYSYFRVKYTL